MLVLCVAFKSMNMIALVLCPADAQKAFWLLLPVFMIDALLNAGITIATNSFLLKHSPAQNRTMFIAAGTAFAGMAGGLTSILAGALLSLSNDWHWTWHGIEVVNFQAMFAASVVLRLGAIGLALRIHEPQSHGVRGTVRELSAAAVRTLGLRRATLSRLEARPDLAALNGGAPGRTPDTLRATSRRNAA
jgi:MFS family permease